MRGDRAEDGADTAGDGQALQILEWWVEFQFQFQFDGCFSFSFNLIDEFQFQFDSCFSFSFMVEF